MMVRTLSFVLLAMGALCAQARGVDAFPQIAPNDLPRLLAAIKPQPGEAKWASVPWRTNLAEARQEAARTDKPLFVWRAGGGEVLGRA